MRDLISKIWRYSNTVEYGVRGRIKQFVFGEPKRHPIDISKNLHLLESKASQKSLLQIDLFPYFHNFSYLPLTAIDFWRHSLVLGASGSGKSTFIANLVKQIQHYYPQKYHTLIIDPHATLSNDIGGLPNTCIYDFINESIGLYDLDNSIMATEMLLVLFKDLLDDQYNPKLERVLRHTISILLENQLFSFTNFKRILLEPNFRTDLTNSRRPTSSNIKNFFLVDFTELKTAHYNEAIAPLISFIDEIDALNLRNFPTKLQDAINYNSISIVSLNSATLGNRQIKIISNLILEQIYLLAISRKIENLILVIDEISLIDSPILAKMLAELRKFGVSIILSGQFLGQISNNTKNAILANTANLFAFRLSQSDAIELEQNLLIKSLKTTSPSDNQHLLLALPDRSCIARIMHNGKIMPAVLGKTLDFTPKPHLKPISPTQPILATTSPQKQSYSPPPLRVDSELSIRQIMVQNSTSRKKII